MALAKDRVTKHKGAWHRQSQTVLELMKFRKIKRDTFAIDI